MTDTAALESEIPRIVYHLYGLTYDEVLIIDPMPPFTREEYENEKIDNEWNKTCQETRGQDWHIFFAPYDLDTIRAASTERLRRLSNY